MFSGNNVTQTITPEREGAVPDLYHGTYTITGDTITIHWADGSVADVEFDRTGTTLVDEGLDGGVIWLAGPHTRIPW